MPSKHVGYIRVSSEGQNTVRQLEGLKLDRIFTDTMTGSVKKRPQLEACLSYLRDGDTLHVHSIDRLARNLRDLQELVEGLVANENLIFSGKDNAMAKMTMQIMGSFAEFERTMIKLRQREGIDAAKGRGEHLGRPKLDTALSGKAKQLKMDGFSVVEIAAKLKLSRPSVYKLLAHGYSEPIFSDRYQPSLR